MKKLLNVSNFFFYQHVFVDISYCLYNLKGIYFTDELSGVFDLSEFELAKFHCIYKCKLLASCMAILTTSSRCGKNSCIIVPPSAG